MAHAAWVRHHQRLRRAVEDARAPQQLGALHPERPRDAQPEQHRVAVPVDARARRRLPGLVEGELPAASVGYVYLPALVGISIASMLTAPLGARLAHSLPTKRLKQVFALFLLFLAARLVWKVWN